jgi:hypothetical protein
MKPKTIIRAMRLAIAMATNNKRRPWVVILDAALTVLYVGGFLWLFGYLISKAWQMAT